MPTKSCMYWDIQKVELNCQSKPSKFYISNTNTLHTGEKIMNKSCRKIQHYLAYTSWINHALSHFVITPMSTKLLILCSNQLSPLTHWLILAIIFASLHLMVDFHHSSSKEPIYIKFMNASVCIETLLHFIYIAFISKIG